MVWLNNSGHFLLKKLEMSAVLYFWTIRFYGLLILAAKFKCLRYMYFTVYNALKNVSDSGKSHFLIVLLANTFTLLHMLIGGSTFSFAFLFFSSSFFFFLSDCRLLTD